MYLCVLKLRSRIFFSIICHFIFYRVSIYIRLIKREKKRPSSSLSPLFFHSLPTSLFTNSLSFFLIHFQARIQTNKKYVLRNVNLHLITSPLKKVGIDNRFWGMRARAINIIIDMINNNKKQESKRTRARKRIELKKENKQTKN